MMQITAIYKNCPFPWSAAQDLEDYRIAPELYNNHQNLSNDPPTIRKTINGGSILYLKWSQPITYL